MKSKSHQNDIVRCERTDDTSNAENLSETTMSALLHFYKPPEDGTVPHFRVLRKSGAGLKNYCHEPYKVVMHSVLQSTEILDLEKHGFAIISGLDALGVESCIVPDMTTLDIEVGNLVAAFIPRCVRFLIFDATFRRADPEEKDCRPVRKVHIDQSPLGAWSRARELLSPSEYALLNSGELRFRIINVWRPIGTAIQDHPLAFADSTTVSDCDLIPVKHIYPDRTGETYAVKYSPTQKFFWWPGMSTHDALIFQCFDTHSAARCAHASFQLPSETTSHRQSLEIRCLILEGFERA